MYRLYLALVGDFFWKNESACALVIRKMEVEQELLLLISTEKGKTCGWLRYPLEVGCLVSELHQPPCV